RYYQIIENESFLCVEGILQKKGQHCSILMNRCYSMYDRHNVTEIKSVQDVQKDSLQQENVFSALQKPRSYM
ncbi:MAG: hypothetical protein KDD52_05585, partial [Bdellovibrionales bacterium]|nr:hypothetical protein [Bdellovibrionales bacterium]